MVIDGNLTSDGIILINVSDAYCPIIVTGNLTAKHLALAWDAHLYVLGTTTISGAILNALGDGGYAALKDCNAKGLMKRDSGEIDFDGKELEILELDDFPELAVFFRNSL